MADKSDTFSRLHISKSRHSHFLSAALTQFHINREKVYSKSFLSNTETQGAKGKSIDPSFRVKDERHTRKQSLAPQKTSYLLLSNVFDKVNKSMDQNSLPNVFDKKSIASMTNPQLPASRLLEGARRKSALNSKRPLNVSDSGYSRGDSAYELGEQYLKKGGNFNDLLGFEPSKGTIRIPEVHVRRKSTAKTINQRSMAYFRLGESGFLTSSHTKIAQSFGSRYSVSKKLIARYLAMRQSALNKQDNSPDIINQDRDGYTLNEMPNEEDTDDINFPPIIQVYAESMTELEKINSDENADDHINENIDENTEDLESQYRRKRIQNRLSKIRSRFSDLQIGVPIMGDSDINIQAEVEVFDLEQNAVYFTAQSLRQSFLAPRLFCPMTSAAHFKKGLGPQVRKSFVKSYWMEMIDSLLETPRITIRERDFGYYKVVYDNFGIKGPPMLDYSFNSHPDQLSSIVLTMKILVDLEYHHIF